MQSAIVNGPFGGKKFFFTILIECINDTNTSKTNPTDDLRGMFLLRMWISVTEITSQLNTHFSRLAGTSPSISFV